MPDPVEATTVVVPEAVGGNAAEVIQEAEAGDPSTHTIKVDGEEKEVTLEELKTMAQRGASADERFKSAEALRKLTEADTADATKHKQMMETVQKANHPGPDQAAALRTLARDHPEFGISAEDAELVIRRIAEQEAEAVKKKGNAAAEVGPPTFEEMPQRVQDAVVEKEADKRAANLTVVRENLQAALDSDDVLATIMVGKRKESRTKRLLDHAMTILSQKVTETGRYTLDSVRAAVEDTRSFAEDIGLLDRDTSVPGSPLGLSRAPTATFGKNLKPGEAPPQISPKDALNTNDYADNVLRRLEFEAMQGGE